MESGDAARQILDATEEALHWTVIWDRALREKLIDPMTQPDARDDLLRWLAGAARDGLIEKTSTGTYRRKGSGA